MLTKKLSFITEELGNYIPSQALVNPEISSAPVGWHIEHALLTIDRIAEALKKSEPGNYTSSFRLARLLAFTLNKLPRGKAKAPGIVQPQSFDEAHLLAHLRKTQGQILELPALPLGKFFKHPYFGNLKLKPGIRFLEIHTRHHLEIVKEISAGGLR